MGCALLDGRQKGSSLELGLTWIRRPVEDKLFSISYRA